MNSLYIAISNILASYAIAKPLDDDGNEYDPKVEFIEGGTRLVVFWSTQTQTHTFRRVTASQRLSGVGSFPGPRSKARLLHKPV